MLDYFLDAKIGIRRFRPEDVAGLYEAVRESIDELCTWMVWCHPNYSINDSKNFIASCDAAWEKREHLSFVIFDVHSGVLVGSIGLNHLDSVNQSANIGYWVRKSRTREGNASAATSLIASFGLRELGLNRLELVVPVKNEASQRTAAKAGAKRLGMARKRLVINGHAHDAYLYSFILEDLVV